MLQSVDGKSAWGCPQVLVSMLSAPFTTSAGTELSFLAQNQTCRPESQYFRSMQQKGAGSNLNTRVVTLHSINASTISIEGMSKRMLVTLELDVAASIAVSARDTVVAERSALHETLTVARHGTSRSSV